MFYFSSFVMIRHAPFPIAIRRLFGGQDDHFCNDHSATETRETLVFFCPFRSICDLPALSCAVMIDSTLHTEPYRFSIIPQGRGAEKREVDRRSLR